MKTEYTPDACEALHGLLDVALAAKAVGHDVFVSLSPLTEYAVSMALFVDGWTEGRSPDFTASLVPMTGDAIRDAQSKLVATLCTTTPEMIRARKLADIRARKARLEAEEAALEAAQ